MSRESHEIQTIQEAIRTIQGQIVFACADMTGESASCWYFHEICQVLYHISAMLGEPDSGMADTVTCYRLVRSEDVTGVSGTGHVANVAHMQLEGKTVGVLVDWLGEYRTSTLHSSMGSVRKVHCHEGRTKLEPVDRHWQDREVLGLRISIMSAAAQTEVRWVSMGVVEPRD